MDRQFTEADLNEIASQLSHPTGEDGVMTGKRMAHSNANMTRRAIEELRLQDGEHVLEIGPGNGAHVAGIFEKVSVTQYTGIDISETMVAECEHENAALVEAGVVDFRLSDGSTIDFPDQVFDKVFTVNTLYFWRDPVQYAAEIRRVLKPAGRAVVAIADRKFMEKLAFTKYIFNLYDRDQAVAVLAKGGFEIESVVEEVDATTSNHGQPVERNIILLVAKPLHQVYTNRLP